MDCTLELVISSEINNLMLELNKNIINFACYLNLENKGDSLQEILVKQVAANNLFIKKIDKKLNKLPQKYIIYGK